MKWSNNLLIATLKESPSDAESVSHQLMTRAGLIRKLSSGIYSYLPLGLKVLNKVKKIVRRHMDLAGAQEVLLPALQPAGLWEISGRLKLLGEDMFNFKDRHGNVMVLGPTHEEVITALAANEINSYKQLPQILYQIQTKFRDEPRPRFGVIRSKEFIMKDAYSFDMDEEGLNKSYEAMKQAYADIFTECGLKFILVEADPGIMGGSQSSEFMISCSSGEDIIALCDCGAAFSLDTAACPEIGDRTDKKHEFLQIKEVKTPSKTTIEEVSEFLEISADNLLKTIIYEVNGQAAAVLINGNNRINETKLKKFFGTQEIRLADENLVSKLTKSKIGFSGPVGLKNVRIIADFGIKKMSNFVCGANKNDTHLLNVNLGRDFEAEDYADLRFIEEADVCLKCRQKKIKLERTIEIGHVFKLGRRYSEILNAKFLDADQKEKPFIMGCYGIGINRIAAACIEQNYDENGIKWPLSLSPFETVIIVLNPTDSEVASCAESIYEKVKSAGVDVILDERDVRAGVKFKDADLIGFYLRIVISRRTISAGTAEVSLRKRPDVINIKVGDIVPEVKKLLDKYQAA